MIRLALRDLRHDPLAFGFSLVGVGILVFAFLLLVALSMALGRIGQAEGLHQNLILIEQGVLQPEESRIPPDLASTVAATLGAQLVRIDPVIFRVLRVEGFPIQLRGVAADSWTTTFGLQLLEGTWPSEEAEVVIGHQAAGDGGWQVGDEIRVYGRPFRVAGIAGGSGTQAQTVWMAFHAASDLFGREKQPQLLVAHLVSTADPLAAKQALEAELSSVAAGFDVYFEDALLREYGAALNDLRSLSLVAVVLAVLAITLGSHNLAWLAAEERTRPLGVLRAVGFDGRAVGRYLLFRAVLVSIAAYGFALLAAILFIRLGAGTNHLSIAGARADLQLSPMLALSGLVLASTASLIGTWLSVRQILRRSPASLLERGPGSSFA